jgi:hypothetical protein
MKRPRNPLVGHGIRGVARQHIRFKISGYWHRKLVRDLQTVTSTVWQNGVEPATVILELLRRADEIAAIADDQGMVPRFPEC